MKGRARMAVTRQRVRRLVVSSYKSLCDAGCDAMTDTRAARVLNLGDDH
jgi:hypothetical protein